MFINSRLETTKRQKFNEARHEIVYQKIKHSKDNCKFFSNSKIKFLVFNFANTLSLPRRLIQRSMKLAYIFLSTTTAQHSPEPTPYKTNTHYDKGTITTIQQNKRNTTVARM